MNATAEKARVIFTAPQITAGFITYEMELLSRYVQPIPLDLSQCTGPFRYTYYGRFLDALRRERAVLCYHFSVMPKYTPLLVTLARLHDCKVIVVPFGIESTYVPDIRYGAMGNPLYRRLFACVMRMVDSVLPPSDSARDELLRFGKPRRIRTVYNAVDTETFQPGPEPRERRVVTACYYISGTEWVRKGLDRLVEAAVLLPDLEFTIVGEIAPELFERIRGQSPPNVLFTRRRYSRRECAELYRTSAVYVQASAWESFGVSLAEAMACGCVPVVTDRYSLPEVVGDTGYIASYGDADALAQAIRNAMGDPGKGEAARRRVLEQFTAEMRQTALREEMERLLGHTLPAQRCRRRCRVHDVWHCWSLPSRQSSRFADRAPGHGGYPAPSRSR